MNQFRFGAGSNGTVQSSLTQLLQNGTLTPEQICPVVYTMNVIGQKWRIPILWHLADEGTLRYNEIKRGVAGITNIMLTQSLRDLEQHGLIDRIQYHEIPPRVEYSLSERGKTLIPILRSFHEWGAKQMEFAITVAKGNK